MNTKEQKYSRRLKRTALLAALGSAIPMQAHARIEIESTLNAVNPVDNARIVGSAEHPTLIVPIHVPGWADELGVSKVERIYKGICGPNGAHISVNDLFQHADRDFQRINNPLRGSVDELVGESPAFNLTYDSTDALLVALYLPTARRAINYIDDVLDNRVVIGASVQLFDFSSDKNPDNDNVIGSAGSLRYTIPWSVYVEGLRSQSQRDNPAFANALPDSSINVLYNGSASPTAETDVVVTAAQLRAIFGDTVVPQGEAVSITFNSAASWNFLGCDVAPTGSQNSLIDVAVHEFTHALGFTSDIGEGGSNSNEQIQGLDIARFRAFNLPGNLDAFAIVPRIGENFIAEPHFYSSYPNDQITQLESGDDNQPSHLVWISNHADKLGVMDPVLNNGTSHCPNFYSSADTQPLDDMGWRPILVNGFLDCNSNGHPDLIDISNGTSQDYDNDNIPDECETWAAGNANPSSGIQGVTRTVYDTPGLSSLASFDPNGSSVDPIVSDKLSSMVSFYNHGSSATRVTVFEFEMFVPTRDEYAFKLRHPDDMDLMIDGVIVGSSTNPGSLTRSSSSTQLSKQMFMQLDSGWHTVRIRGLSNNAQPHFDFIREARSLAWQQPPISNLRALNWLDCDGNGTNDFLDQHTDLLADGIVTTLGTIAEANESITINTCGSDFDTELVLWDENGDVIAQDDDTCGPAPARQSEIVISLPAGTYFAAFTGYNAIFADDFSITYSGCADNGNFEFNVIAPAGAYNDSGVLGSSRSKLIKFIVGEPDCDGDGTPDSAELDCDNNGVPDDCEIPTQAEADADGGLGVIGNNIDTITFATCGSDFDTEIAVFDSDGFLVAENDDFCGPSPARQSQLELNLAAGTYYFAVSGYNTLFSDGFGIVTNANGNCGATGNIDVTVGSYFDDGEFAAGRASLVRFEVEDAVVCDADLNGDGNLDIFDVFEFLDLFNTGDLAADITGDGNLDIFDVFAYLDLFNAGCP